MPPAEEEDPVTEAEYVTVSSKEQLMSVIQSNPDGVSIKVAPGDYIGIDLVGLDAASGISISSLDPADPARFADVNISGSSNISFADIEFRADNSSEAFWGTHVVRVDGSSAISFEGSTFAGGPGMMNEGLFGLYVNHSSGVTVHSSEFTNTERGAMFSESDNLDIRGNYVHDLQSDGFDFSGVQNVVIDGNNFESFYPVEGDHADFIQFWLVGSDEGTENIQISNNFMAQGAGLPVQGIFITGSDTLANTNFSIENNVINQSAYHGITVMGVDGLELNNNTVLSSVGEQRDTWIMLESVTNGTVANNISTAFVEQNSSGISYENNLIADEAGFNGATYSELFQGHITQNSNNVELFELQGDVGAGADVYSILASNLGNSSGTNSDDLIEYTEGDQSISGFLGDDTLIGGSGDDVLFGGWGADHLTGGSGSDTFVFKNYFDSGLGTDRDVITDFDAVGNTDKIDISAIAFGDFKFSTGSEFTAQSFNENEKNVVLAEKADEFGAGVVNLGRDSSLFGSESMTISATFEMNSLAGGSQTVLYNHTQYSISVVDNSLQVGLRQSSGSILPLSFDNVITSPGWQDVQVVLDGTSNSLEIWMNGENLYSSNGHDIEIGDPLYWDVTAGGTPWGGALDGRVADVSVVDQAIDMSQINDLFDRTLHVDQFDEYLELDLSTGNTEVIFNEQDDVLSIDIDGDQNADMEIQLLGVSAVDLDASDFIT
ncbi:right-handed parallel beta-helix repeat-containing protein [Sneathiella glossodoripedis]|uniref:right-handed parallel beta-helix repeat-containing protein n=1 Tax=Sneathiella glossodoripedis TaxID=418853 RepID=UPI00046FA681|nr:right-handed parallel beta-helix repeat-containing protein [Sneathiella glossodoripedis]